MSFTHFYVLLLWPNTTGVLRAPGQALRGSALLPDNSNRMRADGLRLCQERFRLDIRKKIFSGRVVMQWHRLPREGSKQCQACVHPLDL